MTRRRQGKSTSQRNFEQTVLAGARCSCGKVRYLDKADAKKTITRMKGRTGRMHTYRCDGDFWHIGHVPSDLKHGDATRADVEARRFA